jgi:hypothetical protein
MIRDSKALRDKLTGSLYDTGQVRAKSCDPTNGLDSHLRMFAGTLVPQRLAKTEKTLFQRYDTGSIKTEPSDAHR